MSAFITLDGAPGTYISTPDINLMDADTAHLHQSAGAWTTYNFPASVALSNDIPSPIPRAANVLKVVFGTEASGRGAGTTATGIACLPSTQYTALIGVYSTKAGVTFQFDANSLDGGFGFLEYHGAATRSHTGTGWEYFTLTFTTNASAVFIALYVYRVDSDTSDDTIYIAETSLYAGASATSFVRSLGIVGDLDVEIKAAATDWTPTSTMDGFSNENASNQGYRMILLSGGEMYLRHGDGTSAKQVNVSAATLGPLTDGIAYTIRSSWHVSAGTNDVYVDGVPVQGSTGIPTAPASPSGLGVFIGGHTDGTSNPWDGDIYYVGFGDGINGVIAAAFGAGQLPFASGPIPDLTEWTDPSGRVWTFHGGITLTRASSAPPDFKVKRYAEGAGSGRDITIMDGSMSIKRYESV